MNFYEALKDINNGFKVKRPFHKSGNTDFAPSNITLDDINATDWERENFQPTMGFDEVLKGLKEGKKYRRMNWSNEDYHIKIHDINGLHLIVCGTNTPATLYLHDFEAKDWVEVK